MNAKERAEKIAKKAASDDYVEDGGYIRDWLALDIQKEIEEAEREAVKNTPAILSGNFQEGFRAAQMIDPEVSLQAEIDQLKSDLAVAKEALGKLSECRSVTCDGSCRKAQEALSKLDGGKATGD